jgi:polyisoprenoid-binding protein YceI
MTTTAVSTPTANAIPGYIPGRWTIDPVHSDVSFTARHMMVSKVRGHFRDFEGELITADDPRDSQVTATIRVQSVDTNSEYRDNHVRSGDFFDAETHPVATYTSKGLILDGEDFVLDGALTLRGVTKQVPLKVEVNGFGPDVQGGTRAGFTARGKINRRDFGVNFGGVTNGVVAVGDTIELTLEIEAVLQTAA